MIKPKRITNVSTLERKRLMALLENSSAGITIIENPDGNVSYANQKAILLLGDGLFASQPERPSRLRMYKSDGTLYNPDETPSARSLKTGESITGEEVTFIRPDGRKIVISANLSPVFSSDGKVEAVISVFEDVTSKKEIEDQLQYKSFLLDHVNDAIIVLDHSFVIKYWSRGAEKLYGWTSEEAIGQNAPRFIQTKYISKTLEEVKVNPKTPGDKEVQTIQKHKDGSDIYINSVFRVIQDSAGNIKEYIVFNSDITEKYHSEVALKESEEKFSKIFQDNPAPIIITSLDGRIIDANESCIKSMGYTREEMLSGIFLSNRLYADPGERNDLVKRILANGRLHNADFNAVDKSGNRKSFLMSTEILNIRDEKYFISTMLDISEKKEAEKLLSESEEKFSKVFHNNPAGIIINSIDDGRVIDANEKALEILGYSRKDLMDKDFSMKKIYLVEAEREKMIKQLKEKGSVRDYEIIALGKSGNRKNLLISAIIQKIKDEDYLIGSILDITARRESEEALRKNKVILDAALSSMTDALMITDKDGNILLINEGFVNFHKSKSIEDSSMKLDQFFDAFEMYSADRQLLPFNMWPHKRALRGERSAMQEFLVKRKETGEEWNGSYSFSPIRGQEGEITGAVVVSRDITGRIKIQQELKESKERLQKAHDDLELKVEERTALLKNTLNMLDIERERLINVLNMIPAYVAVINKNHQLIFANQVYEKEFGALEENRSHDFHDRERKCKDCKIDRVFRTRKPKYWEWNAPNGKVYDVSDFPFKDAEGDELVLEMGLDITEKKNFDIYVLKKILETEENDKRKFASDLHDDLGPTLSATKLQLSLLESEVTQGKDILITCTGLLSETIHKMRTIANSILPNILENCGLETAIESFLTRITKDTPLKFQLNSNLYNFRFDRETELHLYRIITELITNTIKHSGATKINLELTLKGSVFEMIYSDNGSGYIFDPDPSKFSGIGLQNIRNRVNIIKAKLEHQVKAGKTEVRIVKLGMRNER